MICPDVVEDADEMICKEVAQVPCVFFAGQDFADMLDLSGVLELWDRGHLHKLETLKSGLRIFTREQVSGYISVAVYDAPILVIDGDHFHY